MLLSRLQPWKKGRQWRWSKIGFIVLYFLYRWNNCPFSQWGNRSITNRECVCLCVLLCYCACLHVCVCTLLCMCMCIHLCACMCTQSCVWVYVYTRSTNSTPAKAEMVSGYTRANRQTKREKLSIRPLWLAAVILLTFLLSHSSCFFLRGVSTPSLSGFLHPPSSCALMLWRERRSS